MITPGTSVTFENSNRTIPNGNTITAWKRSFSKPLSRSQHAFEHPNLGFSISTSDLAKYLDVPSIGKNHFDCVFVVDNPSVNITVDLPAQTVTVKSQSFTFDIAEHHKNNLIKGLDAIGQTLELVDTIEAFEKAQPTWL